MVDGERFPAHRNVLAERSEYFRGLLLSWMKEAEVWRYIRENKFMGMVIPKKFGGVGWGR